MACADDSRPKVVGHGECGSPLRVQQGRGHHLIGFGPELDGLLGPGLVDDELEEG